MLKRGKKTLINWHVYNCRWQTHSITFLSESFWSWVWVVVGMPVGAMQRPEVSMKGSAAVFYHMFWDRFSLHLEHTVEAKLAGPAVSWNHLSSPPLPTIGVTAFPESGPHACAASLLPPEPSSALFWRLSIVAVLFCALFSSSKCPGSASLLHLRPLGLCLFDSSHPDTEGDFSV